MNGEWGTICDDNFGEAEAGVVCGMLGFARNGAIAVMGTYGPGSDSQLIHLDNVHCEGNEDTLLECRHNAIDYTDCNHKEDVGVVSKAATHAVIRLVGPGSTEVQGRVEMSTDHSVTWSTVCSDNFDSPEAKVICRTLGFSTYNVTYWGNAFFGEGQQHTSSKTLNCFGTETSVLNCNMSGSCPHSKDVGVRCMKIDQQVRLVNGSTSYEGRIELSIDNGVTWGTVCDDSFDERDAAVVCNMLGYGRTGATAKSSAFFGAGQSTQSILLSNLACNGHENTISECNSNDLGVHSCRHGKDAGVICIPKM
ncbi:hypothetical protein DPMN_192154 [Dreissena polymorpha]|uniref:SRCR domain-containing protein n=1 Tax=Dreissena polymorpha TaxID=45954 RepID=A0A9D3Y1V2_DREPO|nr:hypothetical protein DPMN_192154 [Dreissena polymorpha]